LERYLGEEYIGRGLQAKPMMKKSHKMYRTEGDKFNGKITMQNHITISGAT
jgi:hypothetical protein